MNRDLRHHQSLKRSRLSAQQSKRSFPKQPARSMLRSYAAGNRHCALLARHGPPTRLEP